MGPRDDPGWAADRAYQPLVGREGPVGPTPEAPPPGGPHAALRLRDTPQRSAGVDRLGVGAARLDVADTPLRAEPARVLPELPVSHIDAPQPNVHTATVVTAGALLAHLVAAAAMSASCAAVRAVPWTGAPAPTRRSDRGGAAQTSFLEVEGWTTRATPSGSSPRTTVHANATSA